MERSNLEVLAEEDDEEQSWTEHEEKQHDSEDDEQGDGGIKRSEPNKFDSLCDGVLGNLASVHSSLHQVLDLKDELLKHSLPPNVLAKVALTTTKAFRSISDLHMPVNELIRLVRIYSTPWEEKSAALKKLHEDYEAKKGQLNIAIKRLQVVDAQAKRMNRDKRIMNWEKLFCRLTTQKGHGRRWKFLIESFKKKAGQGTEALQEYLDQMERQEDSDDDEQDDEYQIETQMQQLEPSEEGVTLDHTSDKEHTDTEDEDAEQEEEDADQEAAPSESRDSKMDAQSENVAPAMVIRPPMKDKDTWTHEPNHDYFLYIRVHKPEGLDYRELKCLVQCGKESHKTEVLDPPLTEEEVAEEEAQKKAEEEKKSSAKGRGRLIGMRGKGNAEESSAAQTENKDGPNGKRYQNKFEECFFQLPDEFVESMVHYKDREEEDTPDLAGVPEHLKISVHHGSQEELVAMATIDMVDLDTLELPMVLLPSPVGDEWNEQTSHHPSNSQTMSSLPSSQVQNLLESSPDNKPSNNGKQSRDHESKPGSAGSSSSVKSFHSSTPLLLDLKDQMKVVEIVNFPLYAVTVGRSDAMHMPCGQLPLSCMWAKRVRPLHFNRITESETVFDIVNDMTGFDMRYMTKGDLHKEREDRCVSAMSVEPEVVKETVSKADYDRLMDLHQSEVGRLQEEYEMRLQDLAESLAEMEQAQLHLPPPRSRTPSARSMRSISEPRERSPQPMTMHSPRPPSTSLREENIQTRKPRSSKPAPHWGENMPKNFFDRLRMFEELNQKKKQAMSEELNREQSINIERRLAGEYKLRDPTDEDVTNVAMQDVSLPAVFMPTHKGKDLTIYNPRAHQYFHASGAGGVRLTQPPSMVQLPPLPKNKMSVVNLFELGQNLNRGGNEWLMQRYITQQEPHQPQMTTDKDPQQFPYTPAPTMYSRDPMATRDHTMATRDHTMALTNAPIKEAYME